MANITGTGNNDILPGTTLDDFINGLGGNDTITANDGNDIIIGGLGADTIFAGNGDDEIWGGGTEWVTGEVIDGGTGNNKLSTWGGDISEVTISNVQTLGTHLNKLSLKSSQLAVFSALIAYDGPLMLQATEAGTYSLQGKNVTGVFSITGSSGNDYLAGNSAAQTLAGGDGNDRLQGLGGADILLGGNGDDEFLTGFTESPAGETIDGGAGFNSISSWNVDLSNTTVSNVQKLNAALDRVTLTAGQLADFTTLTTGSAQIDLIAAGAGTYSLQGKSVTGKFNLIGSTGNDYLAGNSAAQTLAGGTGNDVLQGAGGADVMLGGDGDDEFLTGFNESVNETIDGGAGNNTLSSWNADLSTTTISNIQTLGLHLDKVTLTATQLSSLSNVTAYDGMTTIQAANNSGNYSFLGIATTGYIKFVGTIGDDAITGSSSSVVIDGNDGNDTIFAADGADTLNGGNGDDLFYLNLQNYNPSNALPSRTIDGGTGTNTVHAYGDISSDIISNVEHLTIRGGYIKLSALQFSEFSSVSLVNGFPTGSGAQYANIQAADGGTFDLRNIATTDSLNLYAGNFETTLIGNDSIQGLYGSAANTTIYGYGGDDFIEDYGGRDTIFAGDGNDLISINGTSAQAFFYGESGDDSFLFSFARLGVGSVIDGGAGNNTLYMSGDISGLEISNIQTMAGLAYTMSAQQLQNFASQNVYFAGHGTNPLLIQAASGGLYDIGTIEHRGAINRFWGSGQSDTLVADSSSQNIIGGEGQDTIYGMAGDDTIYGYTDNYSTTPYNGYDADVIFGGDGADSIYGSRGSDTINGETGNDTLYGYHPVWGDIGGDDTIYGGSGDDFISVGGSGNNFAFGGEGNDTIGGIGGVIYIDAGSGDDLIYVSNGLAGSTIDGGTGNNTVVVGSGDATNIEFVNIQTLEIRDYAPPVVLTADQFNSFLHVSGAGSVMAYEAGVFDLSNRATPGSIINFQGSTGNDVFIGDTGTQQVTGGDGDDTLYGGAGDDALFGEGGTDLLIDVSGNDSYGMSRGSGQDTLFDSGGSQDAFGVGKSGLGSSQDVRHDQLWFTQSGDDLLVRIIGTNDSVLLKNWYLDSLNQIEFFYANERGPGVRTIQYTTDNAKIQNLVNSMAGMAFPSTTTLTSDQRDILDPVLAANWTAL